MTTPWRFSSSPRWMSSFSATAAMEVCSRF
jgi:hypothetical protein